MHILKGIAVLNWRPEFITGYKFLAIFSLPLFVLDVLLEYRHEDFLFQRTSAPIQWAYASALVLLVAFLSANETNAFIYFQF